MFDFDKVTLRRGTNSLKWDVEENELPLWVADMDFPTAPSVIDAVQARAESGIYGYNTIPREWNDALVNWWTTRHGYAIDPDSLIFATGVVPIISSLVRKLTTPAENVVVMTPAYNIFFNSIENNGRRVLECPLRYDKSHYSVDFDDLQSKLADPQTSLMILCNPHNPGGMIWTRDELATIGSLAKQNGVVILSDEIHCDITDPDVSYTPFAAVSDDCKYNSVTCISATKAFNIAGLQCAAAYSANKFIRHKVWRALNTDECAEPNTFAVCATVAAFTEGGEWLDQLRKTIARNKRIATEFIRQNIPKIKVVESKATYLMWLDCSAITDDSECLARQIRTKTGLYLSDGVQFRGNGRYFLRMNVACPISTLNDALERLKVALTTQ